MNNVVNTSEIKSEPLTEVPDDDEEEEPPKRELNMLLRKLPKEPLDEDPEDSNKSSKISPAKLKRPVNNDPKSIELKMSSKISSPKSKTSSIKSSPLTLLEELVLLVVFEGLKNESSKELKKSSPSSEEEEEDVSVDAVVVDEEVVVLESEEPKMSSNILPRIDPVDVDSETAEDVVAVVVADASLPPKKSSSKPARNPSVALEEAAETVPAAVPAAAAAFVVVVVAESPFPKKSSSNPPISPCEVLVESGDAAPPVVDPVATEATTNEVGFVAAELPELPESLFPESPNKLSTKPPNKDGVSVEEPVGESTTVAAPTGVELSMGATFPAADSVFKAAATAEPVTISTC